MGAPVIDIAIIKGKTFEFMYRYAESELSYASVSAMPSAAPVRLSAISHGIPDGWPIRIEGVRHPVELNTPDGGYQIATLIDESTIELNDLALDQFRPYSAGGTIIFNKPFDLTGCSARMQIRDAVNGNILLSLSSDPLAVRDGSISIEVDLAGVSAKLSAETTSSITWQRGVYDIELITPDGSVYPITAISNVTVSGEVTR